MQFFSGFLIALFAVYSASAQFLPDYRAAWNLEPSIFYQQPRVEEPGLFNFIPSGNPMHTVNRAPTPLGWGRK